MKHISDEQIRLFLLNALFGSNYKNDYVTAASNRAYRDFNRTIRFKANVSADEGAKTKEKVTSIIKASIEGYVSKGKITILNVLLISITATKVLKIHLKKIQVSKFARLLCSMIS